MHLRVRRNSKFQIILICSLWLILDYKPSLYTIHYLFKISLKCLSLFIALQELNRIRRAALSYSFNQLIYHVADLLDKEASNLSSDAAGHLINAASELRLAPKRSLTRNIGPLDGD